MFLLLRLPQLEKFLDLFITEWLSSLVLCWDAFVIKLAVLVSLRSEHLVRRNGSLLFSLPLSHQRPSVSATHTHTPYLGLLQSSLLLCLSLCLLLLDL
jgi:hypothetical protein